MTQNAWMNGLEAWSKVWRRGLRSGAWSKVWQCGLRSGGVASGLASAGTVRCVQVSGPELNDYRTGSDLNCPDAMLSPVKRLFLASRRFSRSFLSNFCNRKGHSYVLQLPKKRCSWTVDQQRHFKCSSKWEIPALTHHGNHFCCVSTGTADDRHRT